MECCDCFDFDLCVFTSCMLLLGEMSNRWRKKKREETTFNWICLGRSENWIWSMAAFNHGSSNVAFRKIGSVELRQTAAKFGSFFFRENEYFPSISRRRFAVFHEKPGQHSVTLNGAICGERQQTSGLPTRQHASACRQIKSRNREFSISLHRFAENSRTHFRQANFKCTKSGKPS